MAETGHASTLRRPHGGQVEMYGLGGLGLKTTVQLNFLVWASKSKPGGRVRCDQMEETEGAWRHREFCVEMMQSREGGMSVRCFYKSWTACPCMGVYRSY